MSENINEIIGESMRKWRIKNKIRASTVAADLEMDKSNFCRMESGKHGFSVDTLIKWSKIIKCSPAYALQVYESTLSTRKRRR